MSTKREREEQENNADVILVPATKRADSSEGSVPAHEGEEPKNGHEMHGEGVARNTKESMTVFDGALDPQQGDKDGGENKEDLELLHVAVNTLKSDLERVACSNKLLRMELKKRDKIRKAFEEQRASFVRLEESNRQLLAQNVQWTEERQALAQSHQELLGQVEALKQELKTQTEKRLVAEREASRYRIMAASLRDNADLHAIGLTPLSPLDGSSVAPTQPEGLTDNLRLVADALDHSQAVEDEVDDEQAQEKVQEAEVQQELTKKARVHVQMTGFTADRRKELSEIVKRLGWELQEDDQFTSHITHLVRAEGPKSIKTHAAMLTHAWIVSEKWLLECERRGHLVDPVGFGFKTLETHAPFKSKSFYVHRDIDSAKRSNILLMVELGGGEVREGPSTLAQHCDYRIVSRDYPKKRKNDMTWHDFLHLTEPADEGDK